MEAVIKVNPGPTAVAKPSALIVATSVLVLSQVTLEVISALVLFV
jgi:hypothetical protein